MCKNGLSEDGGICAFTGKGMVVVILIEVDGCMWFDDVTQITLS